MRIRFNQNHVKGVWRDTILELNTKYNKSGETEFIIEDTDFSGKQLLAMAKDGVEMSKGMRTFIKAPVGFLDTVYGEGSMRTYLSQHMTVETTEYELCLLAALQHFDSSQIVEFSQYGEILNIDEYSMLIHGESLSIKEIDGNWGKYFNDFKQARDKMKTFADGQELTIEEAKILAKWFVLPTNNIVTLLNADEFEQASKRFNTLSIQSRSKRYEELKRFVRVQIGIEAAQGLLYTIISNRLDDLYISYGQEGTMKINYEGVADPYGLFNAVMDMQGVSDELKAKAMDILDNGNY